jgi:hypothetical protein
MHHLCPIYFISLRSISLSTLFSRTSNLLKIIVFWVVMPCNLIGTSISVVVRLKCNFNHLLIIFNTKQLLQLIHYHYITYYSHRINKYIHLYKTKTYGDENNMPNIAVKWAALLLHIQKFPNTNLDPETQ